jgi:hypothetical protein
MTLVGEKISNTEYTAVGSVDKENRDVHRGQRALAENP